jgi:hypothetical protein
MFSGQSRIGLARLRHATGIVIPVYIPSGEDEAQSLALLSDTVEACCDQVVDPSVICLSVDGTEHGAEAAQRLSERYGVSLTLTPVNRGKLQGAREGARVLLARPELAYLAVLDCDSDHFANELQNFVRAAEHIIRQTGDDRVMVLGRRISPHRPMGWLRGELEIVADRILLHALHYHAAVSGAPLRFEYATMLDDVPDFHSGYKLFSRRTAQDAFLNEPEMAGTSETVYYRHAVEAVMVVEAVLSGARLGVINRTTYNRQPVTTFGLLNRATLTADMIIWPCKRLGVPGPFVRQWLDNELPTLLLGTLIPEGRQELTAVYQRILEALGVDDSASDVLAKQPLFI